jgi:hypothetical protein
VNVLWANRQLSRNRLIGSLGLGLRPIGRQPSLVWLVSDSFPTLHVMAHGDVVFGQACNRSLGAPLAYV